jgi:hypothetical protein
MSGVLMRGAVRNEKRVDALQYNQGLGDEPDGINTNALVSGLAKSSYINK